MRFRFRQCAIGLVLLFMVPLSAVTAENSDSIAGSYELRRAEEPDGQVVTRMVITAWKGKTFLVRGVGWVGMGQLAGDTGYYDWKFDDGKVGRTTFEVTTDGLLKGHVLGSGLDWWYLARRPNAPSPKQEGRAP